ncbi:MAG: flagellar basal body P-ring formation protein FlgA [Rhodocyclales bacterium]|nr:flagellar basal body P-ring formation protein FlgA [Rhodocyclales bacterium]
MIKALFLLLAVLFAAAATARQDPAAVRKAVDDYLRIQVKGLPGQASYSVGAFDPNNNLAPCAAFDVSLPSGSRAWGRTSLRVQCVEEGSWSVFVPVQIKVVAGYLTLARSLAAGQVIAAADLVVRSGDLAELPNGTLTDPQQAVGRAVTMAIQAGRPLRADMIRQVFVVQQGQNVKVISKGPGFQVANDGKALNNAAEGQVAQVRLQNGQIVSGIARNGAQVEVGY